MGIQLAVYEALNPTSISTFSIFQHTAYHYNEQALLVAIIYNFQMDLRSNVPSIDQISFKFTQNLLPSSAYLPYPTTSIDSLAYTHSGVSLQYILCQNQDPNPQSPTRLPSQLCKANSLKTTCTDMSALTRIARNNKTTFRQRSVPTHKSHDKPVIKRGFSVHVMSLGSELAQKKSFETPLHTPHPAPLRAKQNRRRTISGKVMCSNKRSIDLELLELQNSIKVQSLVLQNDAARQKSFMRKMIQNRSSVVHAIEQVFRRPQISTSRCNFRLH